jgi:hypothetical protein
MEQGDEKLVVVVGFFSVPTKAEIQESEVVRFQLHEVQVKD